MRKQYKNITNCVLKRTGGFNIIVNKFPKNKAKFLGLMHFYDAILDLCEETPIVYGSLAVFLYKKNGGMVVNDIDALIHEKEFNKLMQKLKYHKIKHKYSKKWHMLQVFNGNLKIEFDSIEFWQRALPKKTVMFKVQNVKLNVVSLKTLTNIYKKASQTSKDNSQGNAKKYLFLKKLK